MYPKISYKENIPLEYPALLLVYHVHHHYHPEHLSVQALQFPSLLRLLALGQKAAEDSLFQQREDQTVGHFY